MFSFNPQSGYGIIVLQTGTYADSAHFVTSAQQIFQPFFDRLLEEQVKNHYAGYWKSEDGKSVAVIRVAGGSLWLVRLELDGVDIRKLLRDSMEAQMKKGKLWGMSIYVPPEGFDSLPLWSTERKGEFR